MSVDRDTSMTGAQIPDVEPAPSTSDRTFQRVQDLTVLFVLFLIVAGAVWASPALNGGIRYGDSSSFFVPMFSFMGEQLRSGHVPGWLPYVFSGVPFAGDPESGWMYAPAMIPFMFLGPVAAFTVFQAIHLFIAVSSTYALGRALGFNTMGATVSALAYLFSPFVENTECCSVRTQVASWIPLALLAIELGIRGEGWIRRSMWWTIAGISISQMLSGWIGQGSYYGMFVVGGYVLFRTVLCPPANQRTIRDRFVGLVTHSVAILALGFGLAAAGVLPRIDAVSRSTQAGGEYLGAAAEAGQTGQWHISLAVTRVLSLSDGQYRWYLNGAVLILALVAPFIARRRGLALYFLVFSLAMFILSTKETLLHKVLYLLPQFQVLHEHVPNRVLLAFFIGPALMAGASVDALTRGPRHKTIAGTIVLLPIVMVFGVTAWLQSYDRALGFWAWLAVGAGSLLLLAWVVLDLPAFARFKASAMASRVILPILLAALIILVPSGRDVFNAVKDDKSFARVPSYLRDLPCVDKKEGASRFLSGRAEDEAFRFFGHDPEVLRRDDSRPDDYRTYLGRQPVQALLVGNQSICLDIQDIQGYNPVQTLRTVEYMAALNGQPQEYHESNVLPSGIGSPLLNALNARYIVIPAVDPATRPDLMHLMLRYPDVYSDDDVRVLENTDAFDRGWIVHQVIEVSDGDALATMTERNVNLRGVAVIEESPPDLAGSANPAAESVMVTEFNPDSLTLQVSSNAPGMLMLSEIYDPGWKATVDSNDVDVMVADHALSAVAIPAGTFEVELRFDPLPLKAGLAITGVTSIAVLGVFVAAFLSWRGWLPEPNLRRKPKRSTHRRWLRRRRHDSMSNPKSELTAT